MLRANRIKIAVGRHFFSFLRVGGRADARTRKKAALADGLSGVAPNVENLAA